MPVEYNYRKVTRAINQLRVWRYPQLLLLPGRNYCLLCSDYAGDVLLRLHFPPFSFSFLIMTLCRMMGSDCTLHATTIRLFIFSSRGCHSAMIVMEANERFFFLSRSSSSAADEDFPSARRLDSSTAKDCASVKVDRCHGSNDREYIRRTRIPNSFSNNPVSPGATCNSITPHFHPEKLWCRLSLSLHHFYQSLKLRLLFLFFNSNFSVLNFLMSAQRLLPPKEFPWPFNLQLFLLLYLCVKETQSSG